VATALGKCLQTNADVKRGSVDRYPLRIARSRVDVAGLPNDACVNLTYFLSEGIDMTALAVTDGRWTGSVQEESSGDLGV